MAEAFRNQQGGGRGSGYGPRGYGMMGPRGRPGPYDRMVGGYGRGYGPNGMLCPRDNLTPFSY